MLFEAIVYFMAESFGIENTDRFFKRKAEEHDITLRGWYENAVRENQNSLFLKEPAIISRQLGTATQLTGIIPVYDEADMELAIRHGVYSSVLVGGIDNFYGESVEVSEETFLNTAIETRKTIGDIFAKCVESHEQAGIREKIEFYFAERQIIGLEDYMQDKKFELGVNISMHEHFIFGVKAGSFLFAMARKAEEEAIIREMEAQFAQPGEGA